MDGLDIVAIFAALLIAAGSSLAFEGSVFLGGSIFILGCAVMYFACKTLWDQHKPEDDN